MAKPVILFDAWPRTPELVCDGPTLARLKDLGELVVATDRPLTREQLDEHLPRATLIMGETDLPASRLERAKNLKAIFNVSGNFPANIDYDYCQTHGIYVLTGGPAFAVPVAEAALGMAIDLVRGINQHDREFRAGTEKWFHDGTIHETYLFTGASVGIIGYGDLGRALRKMLVPFHNPVKVYDPWVADYVMKRDECQVADLDEVLSTSRVIFVFAAPTTDNQGFIGGDRLRLIQKNAAFLLMSRAGVVDFDELVRQVDEGRFRAAVDVFPQEPMPLEHPVRRVEGMLLSGHRTGGMTEAFHEIGRLIVGDAELVLRGLPPQLCRRGDASIAAKFRDKTQREGPGRATATLEKYVTEGAAGS